MARHPFSATRSRPPIHGCPKLMYNGPCAGGSDNICEVTGRGCPWVERFLEDPDHYAFHTIVLDRGFRITGYRPKRREPTTRLAEALARGGPVLSYEYVAGAKPDPHRIRGDLERLAEAYDAVNFVDTPLGLPHVDPLPLAIIAAAMGVEPVVQVSCKDKSRLQIEALVLAMALHGIGNMLAVTGDWPGLAGSENPRPVFDLDAVRLVYAVRLMSDLGRTPAGTRVRLPRPTHVGVAANPYFRPPRLEALKPAKKER
ncbi:MAG: methylenetetrahydrofolate reductase C-terminal domain-containing protein, partial [Candidatus Korarchaeota archaeon]|nr:methylenetetrahydrofolate reductase C-terminal domain-containing protein [Candidatus Korarchaeota archaeon]